MSLRECYYAVVAAQEVIPLAVEAESLPERYGVAAAALAAGPVVEPVSWPPPSLIVVAQTSPSDAEEVDFDYHQQPSSGAASTAAAGLAAVFADVQLDCYYDYDYDYYDYFLG